MPTTTIDRARVRSLRQHAKIHCFVMRVTVAARDPLKVTFIEAMAQRSDRK